MSIGLKYDLPRLLAIARIPALPNSAIKVLELARDAKNGPAELAVPIEADPGLTGQVLKFLNSSYFGFSCEISSVRLAISMVGVRAIKNFVLWSAVYSLLPNPRCGPFNIKTLWLDSLRRGLFARIVAKRMARSEAEEAFSIALLQDMAVPLLAKALPAEYQELLMLRRQTARRLSELERAKFGWDHAQAAALMARQWRFPDEFAKVLQGHAQVWSRPNDTPFQMLQAIISLSSLLPSEADQAWYELPVFEQVFAGLRITSNPTVSQLLAQTDAEFAEVAPVLNLQKASRPLIDAYRAMAAAAV